MKALQAVDAAIPKGAGPLYGTAIHVAFANAVRALNLPGVEVEQSFIWGNVVTYGLEDSIRTDVVLRVETGEGIAIWDVKTGGARLSKSRIKELRAMVPGGDKAKVFVLRVNRMLEKCGRYKVTFGW